MSLLKEIRNQPAGIRKAMFGLSVIALVSLAGTLWFRSFQTNLYSLMNTHDTGGEQDQVATEQQNDSQSRSPFALIGDMAKSLGAQMSGFLGRDESPESSGSEKPSIQSGKAHPLPISR